MATLALVVRRLAAGRAAAIAAAAAVLTRPVAAIGLALHLLIPIGLASRGLEHGPWRAVLGHHGEDVARGVIEQLVAIAARQRQGVLRRRAGEGVRLGHEVVQGVGVE